MEKLLDLIDELNRAKSRADLLRLATISADTPEPIAQGVNDLADCIEAICKQAESINVSSFRSQQNLPPI